MVSVFDAQRVFCLSCVLLDVICMDRDWIINVPKPTLSPYCNLCKSHHLSDEFSKRGTSPVPNSSVAQSVISMTKIAMLIWQPDFDLHWSSCSVASISSFYSCTIAPQQQCWMDWTCLCVSALKVSAHKWSVIEASQLWWPLSLQLSHKKSTYSTM